MSSIESAEFARAARKVYDVEPSGGIVCSQLVGEQHYLRLSAFPSVGSGPQHPLMQRQREPIWKPNAGQTFKPVGVPEGFVTDLTSIPKIVWGFNLRPEGPYAYAAVVHDFLYWTQDRSRDEADKIFLIAMGDSKVGAALRNS